MTHLKREQAATINSDAKREQLSLAERREEPLEKKRAAGGEASCHAKAAADAFRRRKDAEREQRREDSNLNFSAKKTARNSRLPLRDLEKRRSRKWRPRSKL